MPDSKTPDTPGGTLSCTAYCTTIQGACTAANLQYSDMATCVATCAHFTVGAASDTSGDTLGCRTNHAMLAQTGPGTHCVHAGPSGGGVCGMPCEGFCSIVVPECPTQWPSATTCPTMCAGLNPVPAYTANVQSGDSLSCRIYHATAASTNPTTHCPHTAVTGSATCQ